MATIKYGDAVLVQGANVKLLAEAGNLSNVVRTMQSGQSAGEATGRFPVVNNVTYVECSETYEYVPTALGGGTDKTVLQYVDSEFVLGDVPTTPGTPTSPTTPTTPTSPATPTMPVKTPTPSLDGTTPPVEQPKTNAWLTWGLGAVLVLGIVGLVLVIAKTTKN